MPLARLISLVAAVTVLLALVPTAKAAGTTIVYSSTDSGDTELYARDATSGAVRRLTTSPGVDGQPAVSPDGRRIAFLSARSGQRHIWTMRNDGAEARMLTTGASVDRDPSFSPDGTRIAFVSDRAGGDQIFTMDLDGGDLRQLTSSAGNNAVPTFSPDGSQIAFLTTRGYDEAGDPTSEVYVMNADGSQQRNVSDAPGSESAPAFTPDGRALVYGRDVGGLWRQDLATGALTQLTDGALDAEPSFSPDGSAIVFSGVGPPADDENPSLNSDIYMVPAEGGAMTRLTTGAGRDRRPRWAVTPSGVPGETCTGTAVTGRGSALALAAMMPIISAFAEEACAGGPAATFEAGSDAVSLREAGVRWAAGELAPTATERTAVEQGAAAGSDDGRLRTIPLAVGAVAMLVNVPDGCTVPPSARFRPAADGTARMYTDEVSWEAAWAGELTTWGELLPDIGGAGCAERPLVRVVPGEATGVGLAVKRWLQTIDPERGWSAIGRSAAWPGAPPVTVGQTPSSVPSAVSATDGAIGFADLTAARAGGFMIAPGGADDTYWVPLTSPGGSLVDPQATRDGYRVADVARRGANCARVTAAGVPGGDATLGDWSSTTVSAGPSGYPICTLSYVYAWDDACDAYGSSTAELSRTITVRDVVGFATDAGGQSQLKTADLSPLPAPLQELALDGATRLGWATPGGACG